MKNQHGERTLAYQRSSKSGENGNQSAKEGSENSEAAKKWLEHAASAKRKINISENGEMKMAKNLASPESETKAKIENGRRSENNQAIAARSKQRQPAPKASICNIAAKNSNAIGVGMAGGRRRRNGGGAAWRAYRNVCGFACLLTALVYVT